MCRVVHRENAGKQRFSIKAHELCKDVAEEVGRGEHLLNFAHQTQSASSPQFFGGQLGDDLGLPSEARGVIQREPSLITRLPGKRGFPVPRNRPCSHFPELVNFPGGLLEHCGVERVQLLQVALHYRLALCLHDGISHPDKRSKPGTLLIDVGLDLFGLHFGSLLDAQQTPSRTSTTPVQALGRDFLAGFPVCDARVESHPASRPVEGHCCVPSKVVLSAANSSLSLERGPGDQRRED